MRIGMFVSSVGQTMDGIFGQVRAVAESGFDSAFFAQVPGSWDALALAGLTSGHAPGIELGTSVLPTYPRHPFALAGEVLSTQAAVGNRLTLGLGLSHPHHIESQLGYSFDRPARHMREYLSALGPLLRGEPTDYRGETVTAVGRFDIPGSTAPPVLVAALGPTMLRLAGELADGVVTVWTTPESIADYITPTITRASAGRSEPRIAAVAMLSATADPEGAKRQVAEDLGQAGTFPSYKAILERQGKSGVHETVTAGDEREVSAAVHRYAEAGVTDLIASTFGNAEDEARTVALLATLARER